MDSAPELLHDQDQWLLTHRQTIDTKIRQAIAELERGEGISENDLDAYLDRLKAHLE